MKAIIKTIKGTFEINANEPWLISSLNDKGFNLPHYKKVLESRGHSIKSINERINEKHESIF
jgi:hypothetical protein